MKYSSGQLVNALFTKHITNTCFDQSLAMIRYSRM